MWKKLNLGFTLIELMVTVAIVAILASIALPSYQNYILQSRRAAGKAELLAAQQRLERAYTDLNHYGNAVTSIQQNASGVLGTSEGGFYQVISTSATASTYALSSIPQGGQAIDRCQTLTVDQADRKDVSGTSPPITSADCW
jgi:type IV pilus assembly protein PilE